MSVKILWTVLKNLFFCYPRNKVNPCASFTPHFSTESGAHSILLTLSFPSPGRRLSSATSTFGRPPAIGQRHPICLTRRFTSGSDFSFALLHSLFTSAMGSFAATSSQCSLLVRHGHSSSLSPQLPLYPPTFLSFSSSLSYQKISFFSPSSAGFGSPVVSTESKGVQTEAVRQLTGCLTRARGLRFAVVVARFNEIVTKLLLEGALDTFRRYSVNEEDIDVIWVPGSFEIGVVAQSLGKSGKYHAVLCIGAVIRGDTSHYDAVVNSATSGVLSAGLSSGCPCIFGVLTCDDMDQALNRAGGKAGNKGSEAALTAIEMASLFEHHLKQ